MDRPTCYTRVGGPAGERRGQPGTICRSVSRGGQNGVAYALVGALAIGLSPWASGPSLASPQARPTPPPGHYGDRVVMGSGGPVGRYEIMYGTPEFRGLDDDQSRPWPRKQAIRTVGRLEEIPGRGSVPGPRRPRPRLGASGIARTLFTRSAGERFCLALVPVQELQNVFAGGASSWIHQNIEVIGAIETLNLPGMDPTSAPVVFQVWSVFECPPDMPKPKSDSPGSSLEPLVRYPKGADAAASSPSRASSGARTCSRTCRRKAAAARRDWVLRDGPFSIWVTGKGPRGKGWSLDPRSRADCRFRIEATGKVATANGYIYLRADEPAAARPRETGVTGYRPCTR